MVPQISPSDSDEYNDVFRRKFWPDFPPVFVVGQNLYWKVSGFIFKTKNKKQPAVAEEEETEQTTGATFEWNQLVEPIKEEINRNPALDF